VPPFSFEIWDCLAGRWIIVFGALLAWVSWLGKANKPCREISPAGKGERGSHFKPRSGSDDPTGCGHFIEATGRRIGPHDWPWNQHTLTDHKIWDLTTLTGWPALYFTTPNLGTPRGAAARGTWRGRRRGQA